MQSSDLFLDILLVTTAAFLGGILAHYLRLPTIIGFLAAGLVIGPHSPGPAASLEDVERLADIGVILLMFGIGVQFSFRQVIESRRLILGSGTLQILLSAALGLGAGFALGLSWEASLVLGFLVAPSSTVVALKMLESRRELASLHAKATIGILILQDFAAVVFLILVLALGDSGGAALGPILLALLKGAGLLAVTYVLSTRALPLLWRRLALTRSRELAVLGTVTLAIGLASGSALLGLSVAFGAFLAGLAVSESEYGYQSLAEIIPLRDAFATLFFVGMGMVIDPDLASAELETVAVVVFVIVVGKALLATIAVRASGLSPQTAVQTGLLLAQVGEFSFVIARGALDVEVIDESLTSAFLAAAVISILLNPFLARLTPRLLALCERTPLVQRAMREAVPRLEGLDVDEKSVEELRRHVVICGYGGSGTSLVRSLAGRSLPFVVVESDPFIFEKARADGLRCVFGDASRPEVLEQARVEGARTLAVTFPNQVTSLVTVESARRLNPAIDVVTRGRGQESHRALRRAGSAEVVDPEFEAGLEFVRHVLHRYGIDAREISALQTRRRSEHYGTG